MNISLLSYLDRAEARFPGRTAVVEESRSLSYGELARLSRRVGSGLAAEGVQRRPVGVFMEKGIDVWVNFTETETGVLCELRSSRYNINPIAVKYGGGGHAKASGATVKDRATAMAMLADLDQLTGEEL